jgi:hypothetical protein
MCDSHGALSIIIIMWSVYQWYEVSMLKSNNKIFKDVITILYLLLVM